MDQTSTSTKSPKTHPKLVQLYVKSEPLKELRQTEQNYLKTLGFLSKDVIPGLTSAFARARETNREFYDTYHNIFQQIMTQIDVLKNLHKLTNQSFKKAATTGGLGHVLNENPPSLTPYSMFNVANETLIVTLKNEGYEGQLNEKFNTIPEMKSFLTNLKNTKEWKENQRSWMSLSTMLHSMTQRPMQMNMTIGEYIKKLNKKINQNKIDSEIVENVKEDLALLQKQSDRIKNILNNEVERAMLKNEGARELEPYNNFHLNNLGTENKDNDVFSEHKFYGKFKVEFMTQDLDGSKTALKPKNIFLYETTCRDKSKESEDPNALINNFVISVDNELTIEQRKLIGTNRDPDKMFKLEPKYTNFKTGIYDENLKYALLVTTSKYNERDKDDKPFERFEIKSDKTDNVAIFAIAFDVSKPLGFGKQPYNVQYFNLLEKIHRVLSGRGDTRSFCEMFRISEFDYEKKDLSNWIISNYPAKPKYRLVQSQLSQCMYCAKKMQNQTFYYCSNYGYPGCQACFKFSPNQTQYADPEKFSANTIKSENTKQFYHPALLPQVASFYALGKFFVKDGMSGKSGRSLKKFGIQMPNFSNKDEAKMISYRRASRGSNAMPEKIKSRIALVTNIVEIEENKSTQISQKIIQNNSMLKENLYVEMLLFDNRYDVTPNKKIPIIQKAKIRIKLPLEDKCGDEEDHYYLLKIEQNCGTGVYVCFETSKIRENFKQIILDFNEYAGGNESKKKEMYRSMKKSMKLARISDEDEDDDDD